MLVNRYIADVVVPLYKRRQDNIYLYYHQFLKDQEQQNRNHHWNSQQKVPQRNPHKSQHYSLYFYTIMKHTVELRQQNMVEKEQVHRPKRIDQETLRQKVELI